MSNLDAQQQLINYGLLDPPADGKWGPQSKAAIEDFQKFRGVAATDVLMTDAAASLRDKPPAFKLSNDFASRLVRFMLDQKHFIARGPRRYNIIYVEGFNSDGTANSDILDQWNDLRILVEIPDFVTPKIVGEWAATSEVGAYYTYNPMNPKGAARIQINSQFKAWRVGYHGTSRPYESLVQVAPISVCRDLNKDGKRTGDRIDTGLFACNQHHGYDSPNVGRNSAGCLVGQSVQGHKEFMRIIKTDPRYLKDRNYIFLTTVLDGSKV